LLFSHPASYRRVRPTMFGRGAGTRPKCSAPHRLRRPIQCSPSLDILHLLSLEDVPPALIARAVTSIRVLSVFDVDVNANESSAIDFKAVAGTGLEFLFTTASGTALLPICQSKSLACILDSGRIPRLQVDLDPQGNYYQLLAAVSSSLWNLCVRGVASSCFLPVFVDLLIRL